jgi:hypothetical protein
MYRRTTSPIAFGTRRGPDRDAGADRRGADHDRAGAAPDLEGRLMMAKHGNEAARVEIAMIKGPR